MKRIQILFSASPLFRRGRKFLSYNYFTTTTSNTSNTSNTLKPSATTATGTATATGTGMVKNSSFQSFHTNSNSLLNNYKNYFILEKVSKSIREQDYSSAKRSLKGLTRNWLGVYTFNGDNHLALYLKGLIDLDDSSKVDLTPLLLASENGCQQSDLLLASISYLGLPVNYPLEGKYVSYLSKYDERIDWSTVDEKQVQIIIEEYLKQVSQQFDSKFIHFALGKFYMKTHQYEKAMKHFVKSSEKNFQKAQFQMALFMRNGFNIDNNHTTNVNNNVKGGEMKMITKNPGKALQIFKNQRFELGAHQQLIEMYKNGEGLTKPSNFKVLFQSFLYHSVRMFKILFHFFLNAFLIVGTIIFAMAMPVLQYFIFGDD